MPKYNNVEDRMLKLRMKQINLELNARKPLKELEEVFRYEADLKDAPNHINKSQSDVPSMENMIIKSSNSIASNDLIIKSDFEVLMANYSQPRDLDRLMTAIEPVMNIDKMKLLLDNKLKLDIQISKTFNSNVEVADFVKFLMKFIDSLTFDSQKEILALQKSSNDLLKLANQEADVKLANKVFTLYLRNSKNGLESDIVSGSVQAGSSSDTPAQVTSKSKTFAGVIRALNSENASFDLASFINGKLSPAESIYQISSGSSSSVPPASQPTTVKKKKVVKKKVPEPVVEPVVASINPLLKASQDTISAILEMLVDLELSIDIYTGKVYVIKGVSVASVKTTFLDINKDNLADAYAEFEALDIPDMDSDAKYDSLKTFIKTEYPSIVFRT